MFSLRRFSLKARRTSSFEISILFAGPYKFHFEPEITALSHALKSLYRRSHNNLARLSGRKRTAPVALPLELLIYLCPAPSSL